MFTSFGQIGRRTNGPDFLDNGTNRNQPLIFCLYLACHIGSPLPPLLHSFRHRCIPVCISLRCLYSVPSHRESHLV
jgi:hypothetical protein